MSEALADVREGFSKKEIKMAIGVASDPRYKQGNYTGAVNAIEKIKKGLSKHPQVAAVLKRQNEEVELDEKKSKKKDMYPYDGKKLPKKPKDMYPYDEETELDEAKYKYDGKVVKISKKEFAKVSKDYKNTTKGKERMMILDPKTQASISVPVQFEEVELDEQFDFVLLDKDNKIVARASGKNAKKEMESSKKSAHLPPMRIPKNEVGKMKIVPINPKDKKGIGDMVLAIGEEVELDEGKMKDLSMKIDAITAKMKKDKQMKSFADKFKKDAMKSMDIKKSLEKILPDYIAGKDIAALVKEAFVTLFTSKLDEGTWAVPETPAQKRDLKRLMSKPLPLGKEGDNAADKMYSIIGDDELFDDLYVAGKKDPEGDARPIIKQAMKRLKIKEDRWFDRDSWRLDESTKPDHIKVFNSLKRGDKVEINYDSSIAGGTTKTFVIKTKNKVYKGKVDKVTMYPDGKTGGVKFHLYQYDNRPGVYMAIGDMGASLRDIKKL